MSKLENVRRDALSRPIIDPIPQQTPAVNLTLVAHISMRGDVHGAVGEWGGDPVAQLAIEGITAMAEPGAPPDASPKIEYQIVYRDNLMTNWTTMPNFCGSKGLALGFVGIRFRTSSDDAGQFECTYDVSFSDGTRLDELACPEVGTAPSGGFINAIRLHLRPKALVAQAIPNDLVSGAPPPAGENDDADHAVRLRLLSPAFSVNPPQIRNADLIPWGPRHAMEQSWNRGVFPARPISLRVFDSSFVVREGLAFDRDLNVVQSTKKHHSDADVASAKTEIEKMRKAGTIRRIRGDSLLCKSPAPSNYGHYLVEMFPKAWLGRRLLERQDLTYIVDQSDVMMVVVAETLLKIGIRPTSIAWTGSDPVICDRLITIDGLTVHGQYQSPLCDRALSDLASDIVPGKHEKLFVRRRSRTRPLINEQVVEDLLQARGYYVVDPGQMTLKEQISIFRGATTVVAALGAGMTNIAFCPRGATIVALTSASFPDTFFWFQSQHRQHQYIEIRCEDLREFDVEHDTWNFGFEINETDLQYLDTL